MKILGVVVEYNPFHNGHLFHLNEAKKQTGADYVVCVMSGNFIQRGQPALINKWARAEMALKNGVDLVIELPISYTLQSASFFAFGAVSILHRLNAVTHICFGSESGDIDTLKTIARILVNEPDAVSAKIRELLVQGNSYASAREAAVTAYLHHQCIKYDYAKILSAPNNILGIEYIKALYQLNSPITPVTIKRHKAGYHSLKATDNIASATAIRHLLEKETNWHAHVKPLLPATSYAILSEEIANGRGPIFSSHFDSTILSLLRKYSANQLSCYPDVTEGLENRIKKAAYHCTTIEQLLTTIKTKRYTYTRLQRILFNILIDITQNAFSRFERYQGPQYARILGMNSAGKKLLKHITPKASLPIIIKPATAAKSCNPLLKEMIALDFLATDLYTLHFNGTHTQKGRRDLLTSPIII